MIDLDSTARRIVARLSAMTLCLVCGCGALLTPALSAAESAPPPAIALPEFTALPALDGAIAAEDPEWASAAILDIELAPGVPGKAKVYLATHAGNLLVGFRTPMPYQRKHAIALGFSLAGRFADPTQATGVEILEISFDPWNADALPIAVAGLVSAEGKEKWVDRTLERDALALGAFDKVAGHSGGWSAEFLVASNALAGAKQIGINVNVVSDFGRVVVPAGSHLQRADSLYPLILSSPLKHESSAPDLLAASYEKYARITQLLKVSNNKKLLRDIAGAAAALLELSELNCDSAVAAFYAASALQQTGATRKSVELFDRLRREAPLFRGLPDQETFAHTLVMANYWEWAKKELALLPPRNQRRRIDQAMLAYHFGDFTTAVAGIEELIADPELHSSKRELLLPFLEYSRQYLKSEAHAAEQAARKRDAESAAAGRPLPLAELHMGDQKVEIELFEDDAPNTVANFIALAERGYFDGLEFHLVIGNALAQIGCPLTRDDNPRNDGNGSPGYRLALEPSTRQHFRGSLGMATAGTGAQHGSQFYITVSTAAHLNGGRTVFGRVLTNQEAIDCVEVGTRVDRIVITRKREHEYKPATME